MNNLRRLRRDAALTQYALSKGTGVPRVKICHAELGMVKLTPDEVARIRKFVLETARKKSERVLAELGAEA